MDKATNNQNRLLKQFAATRYEKGMKYDYYYKLDTIDVLKDGNLLTRYEINYAGDLIETPISSVRCLDADGHSLKPLNINYGTTDSIGTWKTKTYSLGSYLHTGNLAELNIHTGKFYYGSENDGLIMFPKKDAYTVSACRETSFKSQYSWRDTLVMSVSIPNGGTDIPCAKLGLHASFVDAFSLNADDVNGDEMVTVIEWTDENGRSTLYFRVYKCYDNLANNHFGIFNSQSFRIPCEKGVLPKSFFTGDFDGDGREDILVLSHEITGTGSTARLIDVKQGIAKGTFPIDSCRVVFPDNGNASDVQRTECYRNSDRIFITDYDADGKPELCVMNKQGMRFFDFRYSGDGNLTMNTHRVKTEGGNYTNILNTDSLRNADIFPGDFNGDGCTDFFIPVTISYTSTGWTGTANAELVYRILTGNGNGGFFTGENAFYPIGMIRDGKFDYDIRRFLVTDINRDGTSDVVIELQKGTNIHTNAITFRNGVGSNAAESTSFDENCMLIPYSTHNTGAIDNRSVMVLSPLGEISYHKLEKPADIKRCITAIDNNQGYRQIFSYARAYRANDFPVEKTSTDQKAVYPFASCAEGQLICVREERHTNKVPEADITYSYQYPVAHLQGLGFCGFREITAFDAITGTETRRTFTPEKFGTPASAVTTIDGQPITTDHYNYTLKVDADRHIQNLLQEHACENHITGVQTTRNLGYDAFGNITADTTSYDNTGTVVNTFAYNHICDANINITGQLAESTRTISRANSMVTTGETHTYKTNHLPLSTTQWTGEAKLPVSTVKYDYDTAKRITKISTTPYSGTPLKKTQSYSGTKRTPVMVTEENGIITRYVYGGYGITHTYDQTDILSTDEGDIGGVEIGVGGGIVFSRPGVPSGGMESGIDVNGPVTEYHYDGFGRVDSVTCAYGGGIRQSLDWAEEADSACYVLTIAETSAPIKKTWFDLHDRKKREGVQRPDGTFLMTEYCYDAYGRLCAVSAPFKTSPSLWTTHTYDVAGRIVQTRYPDGHSDLYQYTGLVTHSLIDGLEKASTVDAMGFTTEIEEGAAGGSRIAYTYRADGSPLNITLGGNIATTFEYDAFGRQTAINDPSAGRRERTYDASGRIICETDARGKSVSCSYDEKGRMISRVIDENTTFDYAYDLHSRLISTKTNGTVTRSYSYDRYSRPLSVTEGDYQKKITYNGANVADVTHFINGSQIAKEQYTRTLGTLTSVALSDGARVWRLMAENDKGQPVSIGLGGLEQSLGYDLAGRVTHRKVAVPGLPNIQNEAYKYDSATGNMLMRCESVCAQEESFAYDYLNRLTNAADHTYTYDTKGNITQRTGVGAYEYAPATPYAVNTMPFGTMIPSRDQHITFNALQMPETITEGKVSATFTYGADLQRSTMQITKGNTSLTTTYYDGTLNAFDRITSGNHERKHVLYIAGDAYSAPAALVRDYGSTQWKLHYILRNNQGSIVVLADTAGNVMERNDYDPWGVLRNPLTHIAYAPGSEPELLLGRGYCGSEHLTDFGLINMNARLYDPALCRFLSPDPIVQAPDNSQNFNRYTYCLNNPLRYIDPTGMSSSNGDFIYQEGLNQGVLVIGHRVEPKGWNNPTLWLSFYYINLPKIQRNVFLKNQQKVPAPNPFNTNTLSVMYGTKSQFQYNKITNTWTGKNGKIYKGLKGRGPNGATGSRNLARSKAKLFNGISQVFSGLGTGMQWIEYLNTPEEQQNMKAYLHYKARESTVITALQFISPYTSAFSFGYSLGQFIQDCGIHIRYNPYTKDFTPIEETLEYYDSKGIRIYY